MQATDEQPDACCICLQVLDLNILPELQQTIQQSCISDMERVKESSNFYLASPDSCIHNFHKSCLQTWLSNNTLCPVCQQEILWINVNIPQNDLKLYKQFKTEEQQLFKEKIQKQKNEDEKAMLKNNSEEEKQNQLGNSAWDIKEIPKDISKQNRVAKHDDYPDLKENKQKNKHKINPHIQKDDFPALFKQVDKKNEKIVDTLTDLIQSKIHGNTEIITIQQINTGQNNKQKSNVHEHASEIDGISAFELAQIRQLELEEQNSMGIDHNFIKNELIQLQEKMNRFEDLVEWSDLNFNKYQKNYDNPQDLLWFSMDQIQHKIDKYMNICTKQLPFNCQQIMYQIDLIDKEIEWGLNQKFNFIFDNYEHLYKKQKQRQQDKIIWDYQQNKVQKFGSQNINNNNKTKQNQQRSQNQLQQKKQNQKIKYKDNTYGHKNLNYLKKQKNIQKLMQADE